jgi:hypothetical protein
MGEWKQGTHEKQDTMMPTMMPMHETAVDARNVLLANSVIVFKRLHP